MEGRSDISKDFFLWSILVSYCVKYYLFDNTLNSASVRNLACASLCMSISDGVLISLPILLNEFLLQLTAEFLINKLDPQIGYEEKFRSIF